MRKYLILTGAILILSGVHSARAESPPGKMNAAGGAKLGAVVVTPLSAVKPPVPAAEDWSGLSPKVPNAKNAASTALVVCYLPESSNTLELRFKQFQRRQEAQRDFERAMLAATRRQMMPMSSLRTSWKRRTRQRW